ncbi:conserved hypothetical protein [Tenacibaculum sp. 190524A02b]
MQPDKFTAEEKNKAYIKLFFLILLTIGFFYMINYFEEEKETLLASNTGITVCKVVGLNGTKISGNELEYYVENKKYTKYDSNNAEYIDGELFKLKYSKVKPKVSEVLYTEPVIEINDYVQKKEEIIDIQVSKYNTKVVFVYFFKKEFKRRIYVENTLKYKKGNEYEV